MDNEEEEKVEQPPEVAARPLPPPTAAAGYRPPAHVPQATTPTKINLAKLPEFYFSGNVEIVSDGKGNISLNFKQH